MTNMHLLENVKTAELGQNDGASMIVGRGPLCEPAGQVLDLFRIPDLRQQFLKCVLSSQKCTEGQRVASASIGAIGVGGGKILEILRVN